MTSVHDRRPCGKHTLLVRFSCQHNTSQCHLREKLPLRSSLDQTGLWSCLRDIVWIAKWCRKVQPTVSSTIFRGLFWAVQKIQLSISQWVIELGSTAFFHGFWLKCLPLAPSKTDHKLEIVRQITLSSPKSFLLEHFVIATERKLECTLTLKLIHLVLTRKSPSLSPSYLNCNKIEGYRETNHFIVT